MDNLTPAEANNIRFYIAEEVRRQGRGPDRIPGMFDAWMNAIEEQYAGNWITGTLIVRWARMIEPTINTANGYRRVSVMVGDRICPRPEDLERLMIRWLANLQDMTALEAYKEFEYIHPFEDGNGRTGKIILNWLNGTLLDPIFPPADIFGYPIRNP